MLTVAVLGPAEVRRDGVPLPVPAGRTTHLLVRLALAEGRTVDAERLIEDLWPGGAGRNTLQSKVSQLRRALGDPALVEAVGGSYRLRLEPDRLDVVAARGLAAAAAAGRAAGRPEEVLALTSSGLALFRGEVLADAGDGAWLEPYRAELEELRLALLEGQVAARVSLGDLAVAGELERLVAEHPLREGLWGSLITALYRAGRQGDALATYGRVRRLLRDQLGVDPGPALQRLEEEVLAHSPSLDVPRPPAVVGNLPTLVAELVGRRAELAELGALVGAHRLVSLVGPAGVGKTRTAIEVARGLDVPGGVWMVRLDGATPTTGLARVVAEALQVTGGEDRLTERFAGPGSVLLLDGCEHVAEQVASLVRRLLDAAPSLRVLVTSQARLGLDGEVVCRLAPLPPGDSAALFRARATGTAGTSAAGESAAVVDDLCRALDGLPLAIELAAARTASLPVQEIARRLEDRFRLLVDPTGRRRGLADAIGWSYDLLFPDDQRGLGALGVFAGGAPLDAVEHVLEELDVPAEAAVDVVARLVDRSLAAPEVTRDGPPRYRLLDSVRAFALDRLGDAGLADTAARAHAGWYAALADRCSATIRGPGQAACVAAVRAERENVDAALAWCARHDPALGTRTATGLGWTWVVLGDGVAGAARLRAALAADLTADPGTLARGLLLAGWLEASAGDLDLAETDLDRVAALVGVGQEGLAAQVSLHRAFLRIQQGRADDVVAQASAALVVFRRSERAWEIAAALILRAYGSVMLGDTAAAADAAGEAMTLLGPLGDPWGLVHARGLLGALAEVEGRLGDAATDLAWAAAESDRLGFLGQAALHLTRLGRVELERGDPRAAGERLQEAIAAAVRSGDHRVAATARVDLARVARAAGDDLGAAALLGQAVRWYDAAGGGDGAEAARESLADLLGTTG